MAEENNPSLVLELSPEQQAIVAEFQNAQELQSMTRSRGWEIYERIVEASLREIEEQHLSMRNITKEALWANHIAIQQIRGFYQKLHNQITHRLEIAKDPEAAMIALEKLNEPLNPADLEGEM